MTRTGKKPSRLATEAELAALVEVHSGVSVRDAADRHGADYGGLCNLISSRFGRVADLRRVPSASDLEILRHEAMNAREFWSRIGVDRPTSPRAEKVDEFRTSPFPPSADDDHHDNPTARLRAFRSGAGPFRYRDLTGALLGDPPVGRSALDRAGDRRPPDWRSPPRAKPVSDVEADAAVRRAWRRRAAA